MTSEGVNWSCITEFYGNTSWQQSLISLQLLTLDSAAVATGNLKSHKNSLQTHWITDRRTDGHQLPIDGPPWYGRRTNERTDRHTEHIGWRSISAWVNIGQSLKQLKVTVMFFLTLVPPCKRINVDILSSHLLFFFVLFSVFMIRHASSLSSGGGHQQNSKLCLSVTIWEIFNPIIS